MARRTAVATLAAGCFWCVEAVFSRLKGVEQVVSGYCGGTVPNPTYSAVCSGGTGHAEAVQITFDPGTVSFAELLEVFWRSHDPTTANRQGADFGSQYRSVIFWHDEGQRDVATRSKQETEAAAIWPAPLVTEIVPFSCFYPAENYHQDYYNLNRHQPYCQLVIEPKISRLQQDFASRLS